MSTLVSERTEAQRCEHKFVPQTWYWDEGSEACPPMSLHCVKCPERKLMRLEDIAIARDTYAGREDTS